MSTGARRLFETLQSRGVEVCFANPGTTELDLVRALEQLPALRCVLGLQGTCARVRPTATAA